MPAEPARRARPAAATRAAAGRLARTQRWMQAVVTDLESVESGIRSRAAAREVPAAEVPRFVLPSRTLTSAERIEVYREMYFLRMRDALEFDFPVTAELLGAEGWATLVRGYITTHPSRSYTLNRLSDRLPDHVRSHRGIPRRELVHDLVRLELAIAQVFDAFSSPPLSPEAVAAVPAEAWAKARLVPIEAFRLLDLRFPVNDYLHAVKNDAKRPQLARKGNRVAVYRSDYAVYRLTLAPDAHDLLEALARGVPLGRAIAAARARHPTLGEKRVYQLFRSWVADGLFRAVEWKRQPRANSASTRRRKPVGSIAG